MHQKFFTRISQNPDFIQTFTMIEEILFILHVVNGIYIKFHNVEMVYLHVFEYKWFYKFSYTCKNIFNFS